MEGWGTLKGFDEGISLRPGDRRTDDAGTRAALRPHRRPRLPLLGREPRSPHERLLEPEVAQNLEKIRSEGQKSDATAPEILVAPGQHHEHSSDREEQRSQQQQHENESHAQTIPPPSRDSSAVQPLARARERRNADTPGGRSRNSTATPTRRRLEAHTPRVGF